MTYITMYISAKEFMSDRSTSKNAAMQSKKRNRTNSSLKIYAARIYK